MLDRRVFFLGGGRLIVYHRDRDGFRPRLVFAPDEQGLTQFSQYLDGDSRTPICLLVDFVEEEFREETIPHVFGADRSALVANKKSRLFRDTTYSHAIFQGRETEGRRDDKVLFTALLRPDLLAPWLAQINRHKVPVSGIYSLPILSESLLKKIPIASNHALLVTLNSTGGLRQTFFHEQKIKISRLANVPRLAKSQYASYVLGEVEKIRRYLNSLRLLPREGQLDVYVLARGTLLADLKRQALDSVTTRHHLIQLADVARKLEVKGEEHFEYADLIFAQLLSRRPPPDHYARAEDTRNFNFHRIRYALSAASVLLLLGSLAWSGLQFVDGVVAGEESESIKRQTQFYSERYRIATGRLPETPAEAQDVRLAVETAGRLKAGKVSPAGMMGVLSEGFERFPALHIDRMDWRAGTDPAASFDGTPASQDARASRDTGRGDGAAEVSNVLYQLARVRARIDPFDGDYRTAVDTVNHFVEVLREVPGVEQVEILSLPLNLESDAQVEGTGSKDLLVKEAARFELRVVVKGKELGPTEKS